jgi:hypothetical protein
MPIGQLLHALESYLSRRVLILRTIEEQNVSSTELMEILTVGYTAITLRRRDPSQWRPNELEQLAAAFGLSSEAISGLKIVAARINLLPTFIRAKLLKEACLSKQKIVRYHNYNNWPYADLERLACILRIWQDSKKLDSLLASAKNRRVKMRQQKALIVACKAGHIH